MVASVAISLLLFGAVRVITAPDAPKRVSSVHKTLRAAFSLPSDAISAGADQCVSQCYREWKEGLNREVPNSRLGPYAGHVNASQLEKVCKLYGKAATCLGKCPSSDDKVKMDKTLAHIKYMCVDSTYKQNVQCICDAAVEVQATCEGDAKCGPFKVKVDGYDQTPPTGEDQLEDMMKNTCQLMKCSRDCVKETVVSKCGQAAQDDLAGLVVKGFEFIKYTAEQQGAAVALPQECQSAQ